MYDDAYTIQKVDPDLTDIFNYVNGAVPSLLNLLADVRRRLPSI